MVMTSDSISIISTKLEEDLISLDFVARINALYVV